MRTKLNVELICYECGHGNDPSARACSMCGVGFAGPRPDTQGHVKTWSDLGLRVGVTQAPAPEPLDQRGIALWPGDELLVVTGGLERRGRILEVSEYGLVLRTPFHTVILAWRDLAGSTLSLLLPRARLSAGEEFMVRSLSGREYRGRALRIVGEGVEAALTTPAEASGRVVLLRSHRLDSTTLRARVCLGRTDKIREGGIVAWDRASGSAAPAKRVAM